jgi:hypothetical protein
VPGTQVSSVSTPYITSSCGQLGSLSLNNTNNIMDTKGVLFALLTLCLFLLVIALFVIFAILRDPEGIPNSDPRGNFTNGTAQSSWFDELANGLA